MIKYIFLFTIIFSFLFSDEIDTIISKINEKRDSQLPKNKISSVVSPMPKVIILDKNNSSESNKTIMVIKKDEDTFILSAIINNSALINNKWIKLGEKVNGYKLSDIMDDSVYLVDNNKSKLIFFKQKNAKIKLSIGGN